MRYEPCYGAEPQCIHVHVVLVHGLGSVQKRVLAVLLHSKKRLTLNYCREFCELSAVLTQDVGDVEIRCGVHSKTGTAGLEQLQGAQRSQYVAAPRSEVAVLLGAERRERYVRARVPEAAPRTLTRVEAAGVRKLDVIAFAAANALDLCRPWNCTEQVAALLLRRIRVRSASRVQVLQMLLHLRTAMQTLEYSSFERFNMVDRAATLGYDALR